MALYTEEREFPDELFSKGLTTCGSS